LVERRRFVISSFASATGGRLVGRQGESMELGFKIDSFFSRYGRQPGVMGWDHAGVSRELRYWANQGLTAVELTADLHSATGPFFRYTPAKWREARTLVEDCGLRFHSILA
jgi:hypothetical protein